MIRRLLLLPLLLLVAIAAPTPAWSTGIVVSPTGDSGAEARLPALRHLAALLLREGATAPPEEQAQSLVRLASEIGIGDIAELLHAVQNERRESFGEVTTQFRSLLSRDGVETDDAHQFSRRSEQELAGLAVDTTLLAALRLRVEQALGTATDAATQSLLSGYLRQVTAAQTQLQGYQAETGKMARPDLFKSPPSPTTRAEEIRNVAAQLGNLAEERSALSTQMTLAPIGHLNEAWYAEAMERLQSTLSNLDELKARLSELLGSSQSATERAQLLALLRQIDALLNAAALDLRTAATAGQIAAEMRRQETLAYEKPLGTYSYLSWGLWGSEATPERPVYQNSHWIAGSLTPAVAIPTTGTANYNGQVVGKLNEGGAVTTVTGTSALTVLFDNRGLSGSFDNMKRANGTAWTSATVNATWGAGTNQISGTLNAANGMNGTVNASFFGPAANHVGGSWSLSGGGNQASGVFVGDKQ
ncbi:MAG: factor H binding protein domain-containing protein [Rhodocyclaceae bacterium]